MPLGLSFSRNGTVSRRLYHHLGTRRYFPEGLVIGTVKTVARDSATINSYAIVNSSVKFDGVRDVMILTGFSGQKEVNP